ncbi:MAG: hypothetical protein ACYC3I_14330 [Gemmataceae bacterium]
MNLLCPHCQKMLSVAEEFAGQTMKCPLCEGTFPVPGLPGAAPPPPPPANASEPDFYPLRHEPSPPAAPPLSHLEPPPPPLEDTPPQPPKSSLPTTDYRHTRAVSLNPKVLPWIAPVCLVLVFFLQFLDWDGLYPGGEPAVTESAWGAAFDGYKPDGDLKTYVPALKDDKRSPGVSWLTIFYLLLFFPVLVVTIASVVLPIIQVKLPPQVEKLLPWRWGIVAAANLFLFLFLGLQLLTGFSLDSFYTEWVDKEMKGEIKENPTTQERKLADVKRGELLERRHYTHWLRLVVLLHLLAILGAILMLWVHQRGTHRPLPKLELRW